MDDYSDLIGPKPKKVTKKVTQKLANLSDRQRQFVLNYLADPEMNASAAARAAGYADSSASQVGSRLLKLPEVQKFLRDEQRKRAIRIEAQGDAVIQELMGIAFGDLRAMYHEDGTLKSPHELDQAAAAMLSSIDVETKQSGRGDAKAVTTVSKIRRWDKMRALELLGKHLGLFKDTVEHTGPNGAPIQVEIVQFGDTIEGEVVDVS